jgi:ribonuclease HI
VAGSRNELLTPEEVLDRYSSGPDTGVFTDGSCDPNPGPGGWGFVWVEDGEIVEQKHGHDSSTTNNRMELTALIEAYESLPADSAVTVYSDSQLCVNTVNQWAAGWEKRGWKRKSGPIKNLDLVKRLYALANEKSGIRLEWIRAHDGSRWNEYADALASTYQR